MRHVLAICACAAAWAGCAPSQIRAPSGTAGFRVVFAKSRPTGRPLSLLLRVTQSATGKLAGEWEFTNNAERDVFLVHHTLTNELFVELSVRDMATGEECVVWDGSEYTGCEPDTTRVKAGESLTRPINFQRPSARNVFRPPSSGGRFLLQASLCPQNEHGGTVGWIRSNIIEVEVNKLPSRGPGNGE